MLRLNNLLPYFYPFKKQLLWVEDISHPEKNERVMLTEKTKYTLLNFRELI